MTLRKLPPRKVRDPAEFAGFTPKPRAVAVATRSDESPPIVMPKTMRHESEPWRRAVASLPCVLCGRHGRTQCAHRNEGKGMSIKTDDALTAALCDVCHTDIDQGSQHTKAARRARMDRAILLTLAELARRGLVRAVPNP
jgi:hypothetical protein